MSVSPFLSAYTTSTSSCSPTSSSSSSSSPPPPDCTSLLRSLWSDLSSDVMSVSTSITSWLTSMTSSTTCTTCTSCSPVKQPQRLTIDEWFHWLKHHRATYIRSIPRASHQRRRGTYLLHDDESDDEDMDNWDEDLLQSQHDQIQQQHVHDEMYVPQTCLCQRTSQHVTCRSATLMVAACAGMYERASLKHEEFIAPRHLGVAIDDVTIAPSSPSSSSSSSVSSSSSCDVSPAISIPSSPNSARSSSWSSDDDSDVDMTRSSSPEYHMRRCDSASSLSMDDEESESECENMTSEYLDVATTKKVDKSALRRRSSSTQHLSIMSRSASLNRFDPSTSTPFGIIPKVRRLMTPTSPLPSSSSTDDLMQRLWSIHDGHQLTTMQQSLRDTSIAI